MSGYSIEIIPMDPWFAPTAQRAADAEALVERVLAPLVNPNWAGRLIQVTTANKPQFVSCLGNFDGVYCARCGSALKLDWWSDQMNADYDGEGFRLSPFKLPCCGARADLNDLRYEAAQGFARYVISCRDPPVASFEDDYLAGVGNAAGCSVRQIFVRI